MLTGAQLVQYALQCAPASAPATKRAELLPSVQTLLSMLLYTSNEKKLRAYSSGNSNSSSSGTRQQQEWYMSNTASKLQPLHTIAVHWLSIAGNMPARRVLYACICNYPNRKSQLKQLPAKISCRSTNPLSTAPLLCGSLKIYTLRNDLINSCTECGFRQSPTPLLLL
jgi:hypothetical protein